MENSQQPTPPIPQQTQQSIPIKKSSNKSHYIIGCFVVVLLMTLSAVGGAYVGINYFSQEEGTDTEPDTTDNTDKDGGEDTDGTTVTDGENTLKVTSPVSDQEVNGKIFVEGEASSTFDELTIKVYDDDWNVIGEGSAGLETGDPNPVRSWSVFIDINRSPTTLTGKVRTFPTERGETTKLTKTISVRFQKLIAPGRLILFAPLKFQVMQGTAVSFRGQMKDFLEGNMGVRLKDEEEKQLFNGTIEASGDNYGQFSHFEKSVEHKKGLANFGARGVWELYEIDIEGKPGNVILSIPVRFPPK